MQCRIASSLALLSGILSTKVGTADTPSVGLTGNREPAAAHLDAQKENETSSNTWNQQSTSKNMIPRLRSRSVTRVGRNRSQETGGVSWSHSLSGNLFRSFKLRK